MPIVQIHLMEGRTVDQKRKLVEKVTEAIHDSVGAPPEKIRIILSEMTEESYAYSGKLVKDQKK